MAVNALDFQHPRLGAIAGRDGDVVSFRGVPYATLTDKFADAQLVEQYPAPLDATNFGPVSSPPPGAYQLEMALLQRSLPDPPLKPSDADALNLNIWVPKIDGGLPTPGNLPVLVWIHGGGFVSGAGSWPHYDMERLVRLSREVGTPVLGVSFNFRLGLPGFLTSAELRSAGYKPNNQLRDQRVAFEWLRKHIADFGGDGGEITVAGESAGAVAVGLHLQSSEPLFSRAVMMGGSSFLLPPCDADYQEGIYNRAIEILGLQSSTPSERIEALRTIPMDEIVDKLVPPLPYRPMVDGELIPSALTYAAASDTKSTELRARGWLKGLMVGDCQFDGSVFAILAPHLKSKAPSFPSHVRTALADKPPVAEALLQAYGVSDTPITDDAALRAFLNFATDISFYAGTVSFSRGWGPKCHAFFINERNPWPGMFQGEATHILDAALLFQNFNDELPPAMRASAERYATDILAFTSGRAPWVGRDGEGQGVKVYGPSSWDPEVVEPTAKIVDDVDSSEAGRRRAVIDIGRQVGLDTLAFVAGSFMAP